VIIFFYINHKIDTSKLSIMKLFGAVDSQCIINSESSRKPTRSLVVYHVSSEIGNLRRLYSTAAQSSEGKKAAVASAASMPWGIGIQKWSL
jgi:hypothetical protein